MNLFKLVFTVALAMCMGNAVAQRLAYSSDGNFHDKDDLCATAMAISIAAEAGKKNKVVHVDYNNHLGKSNKKQADKHKANVNKMRGHYGYTSNIFFDDRNQAGAATNNLKSEINKSSASDKLNLHCAGPMEMCWRGANAAQQAKRQFVTAISHSKWNNNHADTPQLKHKWGALCNTGVKCKKIPNQNKHAYKSKVSAWQWLQQKGQAGKDLFKITKSKKGDCSDAGMMHFSLTGNNKPKMNQIKALFN